MPITLQVAVWPHAHRNYMQAVTHPLLLWFLVTLIVQSKFHQYMLRLYSTNQQAKCALLLTSFHCQESFLLSGHWSYTEPTHNSFGQVEHDAKAKIIVTYYIYIYTSSIVGHALLKVAQNLYCNVLMKLRQEKFSYLHFLAR